MKMCGMSAHLLPASDAGASCAHQVQFYDDEKILIASAADFLAETLADGGCALVLATEAHRRSFRMRLSGVCPDDNIVFVDAAEALGQIVLNGKPDERLFNQLVGGLLDALQGRGRLRIYGELVALLCADGKHEDALLLEGYWNRLATRREFELFCGYPLSVFPGTAHAAVFRHVCQAHSRVIPIGGTAIMAPAEIAVLQQKVLSLDDEVLRRRQAEESTRARERDLAEFAENAAEGLHQVAADGTILWANRAELELLGYSADEYIGQHISRFHLDQTVIQDILKRLSAGETLRNYPARLVCKDGAIKHVLIQSNGRFENGVLRYTRCFSRDVTERVAREEAESERNDLLRQAPVAAALLVGAEHRFELANDAYKAMVGKFDLEGKAYAQALPELCARDDTLRILDEAFESGRPCVAEEHLTLVERAGTGRLDERYFKLSVQPLKRVDRLYGLMLIAVDVTDLVAARRGQERASAEREALLRDLERASRAKDEFLAVLGHELRNPLAPIVTALELMKRRGDLKTSKEQDAIHRQVQHLIRLVDDLMDVSRVTRGKLTLREETVQLASVLAKAVEMVSVLMEQRQHTLNAVYPDSGMLWHGDPTRLAQVISNLLTNAARYTPLGGVIHLEAWQEEGDVVICVTDNGRGIEEDALPKVFDLFYQGAQTIERAAGGLGVGLALVKSLVAAHNGTVEACSAGPGQGSKFTVRLPLPSSDQLNAIAPEALALSKGTMLRRKVLIVDDNQDAADLLGAIFREHGHDARVAYDPAAALTLASSFKPEVAFLDIGLPVMDGYELAALLRKELGEAAPLKIFSLTGFGQPADREKSRRAGMDGHFVKPVEEAQVLQAALSVDVAERAQA
jgi:PAS domain S-box-containing protein